MFFDDIVKRCRARGIVFRPIVLESHWSGWRACLLARRGSVRTGKFEARPFVFLALRISICFVNKFGLAQHRDARPVDIRWEETESIEFVPTSELGRKWM